VTAEVNKHGVDPNSTGGIGIVKLCFVYEIAASVDKLLK